MEDSVRKSALEKKHDRPGLFLWRTQGPIRGISILPNDGPNAMVRRNHAISGRLFQAWRTSTKLRTAKLDLGSTDRPTEDSHVSRLMNDILW